MELLNTAVENAVICVPAATHWQARKDARRRGTGAAWRRCWGVPVLAARS
ncbi:MAG: hypothetical protein ACLRXW_06285 [Negativibacillus massiliensis]